MFYSSLLFVDKYTWQNRFWIFIYVPLPSPGWSFFTDTLFSLHTLRDYVSSQLIIDWQSKLHRIPMIIGGRPMILNYLKYWISIIIKVHNFIIQNNLYMIRWQCEKKLFYIISIFLFNSKTFTLNIWFKFIYSSKK